VERMSSRLISSILKEELKRLKKKANMGYELKIKWIPRSNGILGEVKNDTIYVYADDIDDAVQLNIFMNEVFTSKI